MKEVFTDMQLSDLHVHTSAISRCCHISAEDTIALAKSLGYDALAITNHYNSWYFDESTYNEWLESYIAEWEASREIGERLGVRIFRGVEVQLVENRSLHMLIYGADADFLRNHPRLCDMSLKDLFALCEAEGCALVQGHPRRGEAVVQDVRYLHGVEINCHPLYKNSYADHILDAARNGGLAVTVGCDYHADSARATGGIYLPDEAKSDRDLAAFILNAKTFKLKIHEPKTDEVYETVYER